MKAKKRVTAADTSLHFPNDETQKAEDSGQDVLNNQESNELIDPEDSNYEGINLHSNDEPHVDTIKASTVAKKLVVADGGAQGDLADPATQDSVNLNDGLGDEPPAAEPINQSDAPGEVVADEGEAVVDPVMDEPAAENSVAEESYESGLPESFGEEVEADDMMGEEEVPEVEEELTAEEEERHHEDLVDEPQVQHDIGEAIQSFNIDDLEGGEAYTDAVPEEAEEMMAAEAFEAPAGDEDVNLIDADALDDNVEEDSLAFASIGASVHVIHANRIIASMGPRSARKAGMSDVYLEPQFHDVVAANITEKGLRKGLVQSGFLLAKVKVTAKSSLVSSVVQRKVEAKVQQHVQAAVKKEKAMEQSLAIAAVGINRRFFKDVRNSLAANLEEELRTAGVRGASRLVQAAFSRYGVDYAKSILTLANKLSAMPESVRNHYVQALDMTEDSDFGTEVESDFDTEAEDDGMEDFGGNTVAAALERPLRKNVGVLLSAGITPQATAILSGKQSLI